MKSNLKVLSVAAIGVSILAGCGNGSSGNETTGGSTGGASADGRVNLTIATWANETEAREFDEIIEQLNNSQDVYHLSQEMIPANFYTVLQTMIAGRQAPDLFWLAQEYIPAYATNGAIVNLDDFLAAQSQIDMSDFLDGALNTARYRGSIYGLPWIGQPFVIYYNRDMFAAAGLEEPSLDWTWAEFPEIARRLTDVDNEVWGFASAGAPPMATFAWGEGGEIVSVDGEVLIDTPETLRGLHLADSIINSDFTVPNQYIQSMGIEQAFVQGLTAMFVGGANDGVERAVEAAGSPFEVGMALVPAGSVEQVTFNWTASTVISTQTDHEEAAKQALLDLTEAMFEWKVPAPVASKLPNIGYINPDKAYAVDVILRAAELSRGFNNMPQQNELGTIQWEELDNLIITNDHGRGVDVDAQARIVADRFREIIEQ